MTKENRRKKALLMRAVARLDAMEVPRGKQRVVGRIANDFEAAALAFMMDDEVEAMEALQHAAGLQRDLGIDLLGDLVPKRIGPTMVPQIVAEVPALAVPVRELVAGQR